MLGEAIQKLLKVVSGLNNLLNDSNHSTHVVLLCGVGYVEIQIGVNDSKRLDKLVVDQFRPAERNCLIENGHCIPQSAVASSGNKH